MQQSALSCSSYWCGLFEALHGFPTTSIWLMCSEWIACTLLSAIISTCLYGLYWLMTLLKYFRIITFTRVTLLGKRFNSLWPNDAIWRHRSGSTLAQVMAYCLAAPSHYLNQCWLIISNNIHVLCRDTLQSWWRHGTETMSNYRPFVRAIHR